MTISLCCSFWKNLRNCCPWGQRRPLGQMSARTGCRCTRPSAPRAAGAGVPAAEAGSRSTTAPAAVHGWGPGIAPCARSSGGAGSPGRSGLYSRDAVDQDGCLPPLPRPPLPFPDTVLSFRVKGLGDSPVLCREDTACPAYTLGDTGFASEIPGASSRPTLCASVWGRRWD